MLFTQARTVEFISPRWYTIYLPGDRFVKASHEPADTRQATSKYIDLTIQPLSFLRVQYLVIVLGCAHVAINDTNLRLAHGQPCLHQSDEVIPECKGGFRFAFSCFDRVGRRKTGCTNRRQARANPVQTMMSVARETAPAIV